MAPAVCPRLHPRGDAFTTRCLAESMEGLRRFRAQGVTHDRELVVLPSRQGGLTPSGPLRRSLSMRNPGSAGTGGDDALVALMTAYQAGGLEAFEGLYLALSTELRGYFTATIRDGSAAQDLVQETFMEVHRARRLYLPPLPVRPWVFGIARNVLRRHRRKAWRRARHEERSLDAAGEPTPSAGPRPVGLETRDVEEALRALPAGRRDAWLLHHVHGFSFQQVAQKLRIGVGAAKLRSSRAMKALRASLGIDSGAGDE